MTKHHRCPQGHRMEKDKLDKNTYMLWCPECFHRAIIKVHKTCKGWRGRKKLEYIGKGIMRPKA